MLTERLALIITGEAAGAVRTLDGLGAKLTGVDGLAKKASSSSSLVSKAYVGGALLAGAALVKMVKSGTAALIEQQAIDAQTKAAIASTGGIANVSAQHVNDLAVSIEGYSTQSRDAVKAAETLLLSFTAVQDSAGVGNDIFDRTVSLAVDLSTRLGTDLTTSTKQLGRALQDPAAGMTALTRSGISFTAQTKEQIKTLAKQGDLLGAQKLLLDAVAVKVGGAGKAAGQTAAGGFAQFRNQLTEIDKAAAGPLLKPLTDGLHDIASVMEEINAHPFAEKVFVGIAEVGTAAFLASKGLKALQAIKDSELATTLSSATARARNVELLNAEAAAADRAAGSVGALDVAEKGGGGLGGRLGGLGGSSLATLGVFAADAVLVPKALGSITKVPGLLGALGQDDQIKSLQAGYSTDTYGQRKALDALNPELASALAAARKGDYSQLTGLLKDANQALVDNANVYNAATYAANQHTASLKVNAAAAADDLKTWKDGAADRQAAIAAEAAQYDIFSGDPRAKASAAMQAKADAATAASASASYAALNARQTVARDEQKLTDLRRSGKATAQQLANAEDALALAKDRAALAGNRAVTAQGKANAAASVTSGLTAAQVLGKEQGSLAYSQSLAADSSKLVQAGFSTPVLDKLSALEKQFPGTLNNLVAHLTKGLVSAMNTDEAKIQAAQETYFGMDAAATSRLKQLATDQANALVDAQQTAMAAAYARTPQWGTLGYKGGPAISNIHQPVPAPSYTFTGPIHGLTLSEVTAASARAARLARLG